MRPNPVIFQLKIHISGTTFDVDISDNYGQNYTLSFLDLTQFNWIGKGTKYIHLSSKHGLQIRDIKTAQNHVTLTKANEYIVYQDKVLLILKTYSATITLMVYDSEKSSIDAVVFPKLLKIRKVKHFEFEYGLYYIILVDQNGQTCLWTNSFPPLHFVRKACYYSNTTDSMKLNFYINRNLEGFLLMNHPLDRNEMKTFMSANDGRFWFDVEFVYPDRSKLKQSVNFDFRLHDPQSVPENSNWIDIQYEHTDDNVLQPFITLNGGQLWRATPRTNSKIVILKFGSVIVSIDIDSNGINYSFDESTTWFRYDLFKTKPTVLYIGRVPKTDLKAVVVTSEPGSKNLKFTTLDFSHIFKFQCEPKHYLQWTFTRNGETCYRGKNISMLTRDPSIRCVDNIIEHMRADSFCPCTSDDYSCTFNYHSFDDVCILDPLSDTTEQPYDCGSGSHFDLHQMGYVRMAHDSCNPHELHLDTNTASNDLCIENEWTNSLLLFKSKNLYISQITSNGAHFRKQVALEVNLYAKVVVSAPIAFDYSKELIYNFIGKYITQFKISGNYQALLYFKNDTMVAMAHDSVFQVIIFLNGRKQLRVLSLITHFEYVVSYDVTHFTYSPHHKLISFVISRKSFCYCKILEKPVCTQHIFDILQFTIDLPAHRAYFLTSKNVLVIKTFSITPTNLKTLQDIPNVINFAPYDDNLYLLEEQKLMYRNIKLENKSVVLIKDSYVRLFLHRETLKSFKHTCESSNCQFMCRQASNDGVTCGCPVYSKQVDNRCECLPDHPDCLLPHCSGFYCKNSKCLLNNVMCNGVDDCGDGSDEAKCTVKCLPTSHRCRNECIPKQTVCDTVHFEIELEIKAKKLRGVHIFLIILLCLVVPYPLYRFIRLCYRRLNRRRLRLKFWSQSNFQTPEFEMLIEPEVNSMAYVGMY